MLRYQTFELVHLLNRISEWSDHAYICDSEGKNELTANDRQQALELLNDVERHCSVLCLVKVKGRLDPFKHQLEKNEKCTYPVMESELGKLRKVIASEIQERHFTFIPPANAPYFEQDSLFGPDVYAACSDEVRAEIKQAGNCLATDLHTAAAFHLIRVAELGLRALARELGLANIDGVDLEFVTLETLIKKIDEVVTGQITIIGRPANHLKEEERNYFRGILTDARYFKDETRNPVAHVRIKAHQRLSQPSLPLNMSQVYYCPYLGIGIGRSENLLDQSAAIKCLG